MLLSTSGCSAMATLPKGFEDLAPFVAEWGGL
jgi:hypothetical protein